MSSKIVISGYYGFNNAGDEAVLASMIEALHEEIEGLEITVLSHAPEVTEKQYGVRAVNRWRLGEVLAEIKECDLFISGGGSLLQDVTGPKSILYYLALIKIAKLYKKPVMFYAQGIGPVKRPWARRLLARVANGVNLITVRDENSKEDLYSMGVSKPPVHVTADPVLGWSGDNGESAEDVLCRAHAEGGPFVGVSLRHWDGMDMGEMAAVCDAIVEKGYKILFIPFHFPGDIGASREVAKLMKNESHLIKENLTPAEMMDAVGRMHMIIGMRLHALIMAAAKGVPFVAVSYDPKVERFASQAGQIVACSVENMSCANLLNQVEQILKNHSQNIERLNDKVAGLKVKARENARFAKQVLDS